MKHHDSWKEEKYSHERYFPNEKLYLPLSTVNVIRFDTNTVETFDTAGSVVATPTIVDLEQDGKAEILLCTNAPSWEWTLTALQLDVVVPARPTWSGYMGSSYDGIFE